MASMPIRRRAEGFFYECTTVNDQEPNDSRGYNALTGVCVRKGCN